MCLQRQQISDVDVSAARSVGCLHRPALAALLAMDAPETDFDVKLQKVSSDLLADLDKALTTALRKPIANGGTRVRLFVRARETFKSTTEVNLPQRR